MPLSPLGDSAGYGSLSWRRRLNGKSVAFIPTSERTVGDERLLVRVLELSMIGRMHWFLGGFLLVGGHLVSSTTSAQEAAPNLAARNLFSAAAELQNARQFDLAAESWDRYLESFPEERQASLARYYAGVCRMQLKQFAVAEQHFVQALVRNTELPQADEAYLNLGWCRFAQGRGGDVGKLAEARAAFEQLLEKFPRSSHVPRTLYYIGETHYAAEEWDRAFVRYQQLVDRFPESELKCDALFALGTVHEERAEFKLAIDKYDAFLAQCEVHPLSLDVTMHKAEALLLSGSPGAAEPLFAKLAATNDFADADQALLRQGTSAALLDNHQRAGDLFTRLVEQFPRSPSVTEATLSAGRAYYRAGRIEQAEEWLQKSLRLPAPEATEAAHWLAVLLLQKDQPQRALQVADENLARSKGQPFEFALRLDRADALFTTDGRKRDALTAYRELVEQFPNHESAPLALYYTAFAALELEEPELAADYSQQFLRAHAEHELLPDVLYVLAESALEQNDFDKAAASYDRLLEKHSEHADRQNWRFRRAYLAFLQRQYQVAIEGFAPLLKEDLDPEMFAEAAFFTGVSHFQLDQFADAQRQLQAAFKASSRGTQAAETLLYLARAQQRNDEVDAAVQTLQQLLDAFPNASLADRAYYRMAEFEAQRGRVSNARDAYQAVVQRWPSSALAPFAWYGLGLAELKADQASSAAKAFSQVIESFPRHGLFSNALLGRGMALRQMKQFQPAIADFDAFLARGDEPTRRGDALYEKGLAQAALGEHAAARASWKELLRSSPDYKQAANVLYEMAWAADGEGQTDEMNAAFEQLVRQFPDHPLAAEAHFRIGEYIYERGAYAKAAEHYQQAARTARDDSLAEQSAHKLGWALYRQDEFGDAADAFADQLQRFPKGGLAADARFMQAEGLFGQREYAAALAAYQRSIDEPPSTKAMQALAYFHAGQAAGQTEQWQEAVVLFDALTSKFPDSPYAAQVALEGGKALQKLDRKEDAVARYEQAALLNREAVGAQARFMLGEIHFEERDFDAAIKDFRRVMYGFGGTEAPASVQAWQAMAAFEAGRCAEVQKQRADALTFYGYLVERFPEHEFAEQARDKIKALESN